jgi:sugar phosphate isomerase/epimerase
MRMKLAMNSQYFVNQLGNEAAAKLIADAGFDSVDYSVIEMDKPGCVFNEKNWLEEAENVGKVFRTYGVPVTQTHAPFHFSDFADPVVYQDSIFPTIARSVEVSAAMGADIIVVHPLHYLPYAGHEEEIFSLNMDFNRSLIPVCKNCGIKVAVENMFQREKRRGHIVHDTCSRAEEFCRYIDTLDSEYIVGCLDVGHVGLPMQTDEAYDVVRKLGHDRLKALHIHDNDYKEDRHGIPYSGLINWDEVMRSLADIDYTGEFTYEISMAPIVGRMDPGLYPDNLRYIHQVGRHLVDKFHDYRGNKE